MLLKSVLMAVGCTPVPAVWQGPAGVAGIVIGLIAITMSRSVAARGRASRPVAIVVGAGFVAIGALTLFGVIHLAERCP